jgi:hypothetical protein
MNLPSQITFGELRASGVRDSLAYCRKHRSSHHVEANAAARPMTVCMSALPSLFYDHAGKGLL